MILYFTKIIHTSIFVMIATWKVLAAILRNAPYKTLPFGDARSWPFFYKGSSGERPHYN